MQKKALSQTRFEIYFFLFYSFSADPEGPGFAAMVLTFLSIVLIVITMPFSLCLVIKVNKFKN